jgi:hypothetical protein
VSRFIGYSLVVTTNNYYTNRLLVTDFNIEVSTSNHYEVFLLFRL